MCLQQFGRKVSAEEKMEDKASPEHELEPEDIGNEIS